MGHEFVEYGSYQFLSHQPDGDYPKDSILKHNGVLYLSYDAARLVSKTLDKKVSNFKDHKESNPSHEGAMMGYRSIGGIQKFGEGLYVFGGFQSGGIDFTCFYYDWRRKTWNRQDFNKKSTWLPFVTRNIV